MTLKKTSEQELKNEDGIEFWWHDDEGGELEIELETYDSHAIKILDYAETRELFFWLADKLGVDFE